MGQHEQDGGAKDTALDTTISLRARPQLVPPTHNYIRRFSPSAGRRRHIWAIRQYFRFLHSTPRRY